MKKLLVALACLLYGIGSTSALFFVANLFMPSYSSAISQGSPVNVAILVIIVLVALVFIAIMLWQRKVEIFEFLFLILGSFGSSALLTDFDNLPALFFLSIGSFLLAKYLQSRDLKIES